MAGVDRSRDNYSTWAGMSITIRMILAVSTLALAGQSFATADDQVPPPIATPAPTLESAATNAPAAPQPSAPKAKAKAAPKTKRTAAAKAEPAEPSLPLTPGPA